MHLVHLLGGIQWETGNNKETAVNPLFATGEGISIVAFSDWAWFADVSLIAGSSSDVIGDKAASFPRPAT